MFVVVCVVSMCVCSVLVVVVVFCVCLSLFLFCVLCCVFALFSVWLVSVFCLCCFGYI